MSRPPESGRPAGAIGDPTVDRATAARLLRAARSASARGSHDESVGWAFSVMPDSAGARRLRVEQLLAHEDYETADAVIARGLRRRPTDASLSLLRAKSLYGQQRLEAAGHELRLVLSRRPHHLEARELAGMVAMRRGAPLTAVTFFEQVEARRPTDRIRDQVARAWLEAGRPRMARKVLNRMTGPSSLLRSKVLAAEGRLLEATETLDRARSETTGREHDAVMCALIGTLEQMADLQRLRRLLAPLGTEQPVVLARAGTAWLAMGAFHTAAVRMAALSRVRGYRAPALATLMVAAAMMNRTSLAERALRRLRRIDEPIDRTFVAEAWSRGLLGRLLLDQCSARKAGADPHTGRLQSLLRDASRIFQDDLATGEAVPAVERRELRQHLALCEQVAGLCDHEEGGAGASLTDILPRPVADSIAA